MSETPKKISTSAANVGPSEEISKRGSHSGTALAPKAHPKTPNQKLHLAKVASSKQLKTVTPEPKKQPLKKASSAANFDISDVIVCSELTGRINTAKWLN